MMLSYFDRPVLTAVHFLRCRRPSPCRRRLGQRETFIRRPKYTQEDFVNISMGYAWHQKPRTLDKDEFFGTSVVPLSMYALGYISWTFHDLLKSYLLQTPKMKECNKTGFSSLTKILFMLSLSASIVDGIDSFVGLCVYPFHFGIGKLKGTVCEVSYQIETADDVAAFDMCENNSPFPVQDAKPGFPTLCTYEKLYYCNEDEISIGKSCFSVRGGSSVFSKSGCGKRYKLHVIEDRTELKWIVALLYHKSRDFLWIGNAGPACNFLNPVTLPPENGQGIISRELKPCDTPIKIVMSYGAMRFIRRGTAVYGSKDDLHPYVCSRPAEIFEEEYCFKFSGRIPDI
ncbi:hypothetical protein RB195_015898 [Necator americanus]|uniref:Uncharacterized protein n=1 Tax=Necator americanus TaxID=51031 RepID=A0ABR1E9B4_NECAM